MNKPIKDFANNITVGAGKVSEFNSALLYIKKIRIMVEPHSPGIYYRLSKVFGYAESYSFINRTTDINTYGFRTIGFKNESEEDVIIKISILK